jgi:hypothetical protein
LNNEKLLESLKEANGLLANCIAMLERNPRITPKQPTKGATRVPAAAPAVDFSLPFRPFINRYMRPNMSGREKFTLVVAFLAKGSVKTEVTLEAIQKLWNSMTSRLEEFNLAHSTRAKDKGWVDSPKRGSYVLLAQWQEILHGN